MNTRSTFHTATAARSSMVATALALSVLAGCTTMAGRPAEPLLVKRETPGVVLCQSARSSDGGIRIIGKLEKGIYPITRATIQYKIATPSDSVPATVTAGGKSLELMGGRSEKVAYRKGADEVVFGVDPDAARGLRGKVLWYRWIIEYDRGGSVRLDATDLHRTSLEEAGLPRSAGSPGPDSSVGLPSSTRRR